MRLMTLTTAALLAALAGPAFAQLEVSEEQFQASTSAIETADLEDPAYQDMWCAAAYGVAQQMNPNDAEVVAKTKEAQELLFRRAGTPLITSGMTADDFGKLAEQFAYVVMYQVGTEGEEPDYTEDECGEAVDSAK